MFPVVKRDGPSLTRTETAESSGRREGAWRVTRWLVLWLTLYFIGITVYNASYAYTRDVLIHSLQVRPAAWLIQATLPSMDVHTSVTSIYSGRVELNILRGCDGMEVWIVLISALAAFPVSFARRVRGIIHGTLFIFSFNLLRIVSLFHLALLKPAWFSYAHGVVWQSAILLGAVGFIMVWLQGPESKPVWRALFRVVSTFAVVVGFVSLRPGWWLTIASPLFGFLNDVLSPYLNGTSIQIEGPMLYGTVVFDLGMNLIDGNPVPLLPITWHYSAGLLLHILVISITTWAMPPMDIRSRLAAFPFVLLFTALVSSVDLSVELQEQTFRAVARDWLPGFQFMADESNQKANAFLQYWSMSIRWIKEFHNAGGRLFLGAITGLIGCAVPYSVKRWRKRRGTMVAK